jgi:plasmid stability protein
MTVLTALVLSASACTRVETGSVGVRVNMSKEIQGNELVPGSWNQTVVGDVLTFPTKDITVQLDNKTPMTADNSALADFDITIVYGINPSSVAELYSTKSKAFHAYDEKSADTFLMYNYMTTLVNNASYKVIRNYTNLQAADNRQKIEQEIRDIVTEQLKEEKLDNSLSLMVVQVRNILPNAAILQSATNLVRSQNELKVKENEVKIAEAESRRMQALAQNSGQSIAYMNAQAQLTIAEAVREGKVSTIIIPHNMTALGSFK